MINDEQGAVYALIIGCLIKEKGYVRILKSDVLDMMNSGQGLRIEDAGESFIIELEEEE